MRSAGAASGQVFNTIVPCGQPDEAQTDETACRECPQFRVCCRSAASEVMGHVWTAPAVQEESDYQRSVRVRSCIRPVFRWKDEPSSRCSRMGRWPCCDSL